MSGKAFSRGGRVRTITGMRGGLGRTLLSAFLLLTIVPLAVIGFLAVNWTRRDLRQEVATRLIAVARLKEAEIEAWTASLTVRLAALADDPANRRIFLAFLSSDPLSDEIRSLGERTLEVARDASVFEEIGLLDVYGQVRVGTDLQRLAPFAHLTPSPVPSCLTGPLTDRPAVMMWRAVQDDMGNVRGYLIGLPNLQALDSIMAQPADLGETGEVYLAGSECIPLTSVRFAAGWPLEPSAFRTSAVEAALSGQSAVDLYTGYHGEPVIGAYRWLPSLSAALIAEQTQREAFARDDALATLLIGATLAVALFTTLLSAVITRRLIHPIVQLTLSAVKIAGGNLQQMVPVDRRDEIGVLAQAFNVMTAELRSLYFNLEQKVAERTRQLREANQRLRYQAMQLDVSAEMGRAITSVLDLDELLQKVVKLIRSSYRLLRVDIYLLGESGRHVVRQARSGWDGSQVSYTDSQILDHDSLIGQASEDGRPHVDDVRTSLAIPLRAGQRVVGVLKLQAYQNDEISEADVSALQSLADQVSVAIQNAQTYAVERDTVERLHRLAQTRAQSLGSMSRELATSLNSIIGFSRLILKGVDGPLTEQQRSDVSVINRSGQHLLGLLDDILELVDLESSEKPLERMPVELCEVMAHVLNRVSTVAEDRSIALHFECPANLPSLQADGVRLGQVLTHLISSVLETAEGDAVMVGARLGDASGRQVMVSVTSDLEVPCLNGLEDIKGCMEDLSDNGIGWDGTESSIKLMLSRRIIELHGGHLWVGGPPSRQVTFVFTLPVAEGCSLVDAESKIGEQAEGKR